MPTVHFRYAPNGATPNTSTSDEYRCIAGGEIVNIGPNVVILAQSGFEDSITWNDIPEEGKLVIAVGANFEITVNQKYFARSLVGAGELMWTGKSLKKK